MILIQDDFKLQDTDPSAKLFFCTCASCVRCIQAMLLSGIIMEAV